MQATRHEGCWGLFLMLAPSLLTDNFLCSIQISHEAFLIKVPNEVLDDVVKTNARAVVNVLCPHAP